MATDLFAERPRRRIRSRSGALALHAFLLAGSVVMLLPFAWMLSTSLKTPPETFAYPPIWIPKTIAWDNYSKTVAAMPFGRFYLNSLIVTVSVTVLQILTASLAAFAFARLRFRGRNALFLLYLATLMIPFQVTMIPNFILVRLLGWYDTYQGQFKVEWNLLMAGSVIAMLPVLAVYIVAQRWFIRGIAMSGMGGR